MHQETGLSTDKTMNSLLKLLQIYRSCWDLPTYGLCSMKMVIPQFIKIFSWFDCALETPIKSTD